jgi:hypothetical protein
MKQVFAALLLMTLSSCAVRPSLFLVPQDKRLERLQKEKDKLKGQVNDPVGRAKTQIKIADILLTLVSDSVKTGDSEVVEARLEEYTAAIQDAHQTMVQTRRDAHRKPAGFKDLEIALRRQVRQLDDIGGALAFDQRAPVEKAREEAANIREELLKALFGSENAPSRNS